MKTFLEYALEKGIDLTEAFGPNAIPINPNGQGAFAGKPQAQPAVDFISKLSTIENRVRDANWHQLYEIFYRQNQKFPNNPELAKFGMALYRSGSSGNMVELQPYVQKYLQARKM